MNNPGVWIAIAVGGGVVGTISALHQYTSKGNEPFNIRPIIRDFCLGAFLAAAVYMFLPESIDSWISAGSSLKDSLVPKLGSMTSVFGATPASVSVSTPDIELQTGPARF